jgi:hypothetical protein
MRSLHPTCTAWSAAFSFHGAALDCFGDAEGGADLMASPDFSHYSNVIEQS